MNSVKVRVAKDLNELKCIEKGLTCHLSVLVGIWLNPKLTKQSKRYKHCHCRVLELCVPVCV